MRASFRIESYVSELGNILIKTLIERKEKTEKAEKLLYRWVITTLFCLGVGVSYLLLALSSVTNILTNVKGDMSTFVFICLFVFCFLQISYSNKKFKKYEKEYDELRFEIIERSEELWDTEERRNKRAVLYELLKEEYDVNLFHK